MDSSVVLARFDSQIRQHPEVGEPGAEIEADGNVVRTIAASGGWTGVTWCALTERTADAAIAEQIRRFASLGRPWEWKHYSHDLPADLPERLQSAGLVAEPAETLMVAELADLPLDVPPPAGVRLEPVTEARQVQTLVDVHDNVFGGDHSRVGRALLARLTRRPRAAAAVIAWHGATPIAAGRVEFHPGTDFASLWGGGTLQAWRSQGVFRAMVSWRAALAAAEGFRYLQIDAAAASRPILQRLGFVPLAVTTPFVHPGPAG